ncbi:MAG: transcription elongation factor GreA [Bacteroidota bacterium]
MGETTYLTKDGYERLKKELATLKGPKRKEIADQIQRARELGDLSENAEYDAAKDAQGLLEMEIGKLENKLATAKILDETNIDISKVYILSTVRLMNLKMKKEFKYTLVPEEEQNVRQNKISVKSPVGKALIGKEVGDVVEIKVPAGAMQFEVLEISRE